MTAGRARAATRRRPALRQNMTVDDFKACYWMKERLIAFARQLGLSVHGYKPELVRRIERRLRGLPDEPERRRQPGGARDSDRSLRRSTAVVNYKSDEKTRAFFESQIGPHFHFTYRLNQYRLSHANLTYGDLIDEWTAEHERRKQPDYRAPIASQGEYNRYIRDFFADEGNKGKSFRDAAASWNVAKRARGEARRYRPRPNRRHRPS
jgi:hypothetical protein